MVWKSTLTNKSHNTLNRASSAQDIASAYNTYIQSAGGNTAANQAEANQYLQSLGITQDRINHAYDVFKAAPSATKATYTPPTVAWKPTDYNSLSATSTPTAIAKAYNTFVDGRGGISTPQTRDEAVNFLQGRGVTQDKINHAYDIFRLRDPSGSRSVYEAPTPTTPKSTYDQALDARNRQDSGFIAPGTIGTGSSQLNPPSPMPSPGGSLSPIYRPPAPSNQPPPQSPGWQPPGSIISNYMRTPRNFTLGALNVDSGIKKRRGWGGAYFA